MIRNSIWSNDTHDHISGIGRNKSLAHLPANGTDRDILEDPDSRCLPVATTA